MSTAVIKHIRLIVFENYKNVNKLMILHKHKFAVNNITVFYMINTCRKQ